MNNPFNRCTYATHTAMLHTLHLWIGGKHLNGLMMLISVGIANQQGKHRFGWHILLQLGLEAICSLPSER